MNSIDSRLDRLLSAEPARVATAQLPPAVPSVRPLAPAFVYVSALILLFAAISTASGFAAGAANREAVVALLALGSSGGCLSYLLSREMVPGAAYAVPRPALLSIAALLPLVAFITLFGPYPHAQFWARSWTCFRFGALVGLPASIVFAFVLRRGAFMSPVFAAITAGLLAGFTGTLALEVHCPNPDLGHILLSHYGTAAAGAAAGFGIAKIREVIY